MNSDQASGGARIAELAERLASVRRRIEVACDESGRAHDSVTLVAVTKTYPASDVIALSELGVSDVGENRDQEAAAKRLLVDDQAPGLTWHCIGQVQTNKVRSIVRWADVVHSMDRDRLVTAFASACRAQDRDRPLEVLIQVSLDEDTSRGGCREQDVERVADAIEGAPELALRGVMAVAPLQAEPAQAFERLQRVSHELRRQHPGAGWISAGMSQDLEAAIGAGATHVRVGSAVLGQRPPVR